MNSSISMPSTRRNRSSVHSAIDAAGSPTTAPASTTSASSTPPSASVNSSVLSISTLSSSARSVRTVDDLIAERLAENLPKFTATNATEFMHWAYLVFNHFNFIPGYRKSILELPREEIVFTDVNEAQIEFLYTYLWQRLFPIVSQISGIHTKLQRVPMLDVHGLWRVLKEVYCPQTNIELVQKGRMFLEMTQGTQSIREFTTRVLAERDLLTFMGILKSDDEVRNTIIGGLLQPDAQTFAFRFVGLPIDRFVEEVNQYDTLVAIQAQRRSVPTTMVMSSTNNTRDIGTALLTEVSPYPNNNIQCWHCEGWGHIRDHCPDILVPKEELPKRKGSRVEGVSFASSGRNRGSSHYRGRRWHKGGRYRGRRRGNGSYTHSSCSTTTSNQESQPEGRAAVAIVEAITSSEVDNQLSGFDWTSVSSFRPMANTFELGPHIQEEHDAIEIPDSRFEEEHIILSAIDDGEDINMGTDEGMLMDTSVATIDVPPAVIFANVVNVEMLVALTFDPDPKLGILKDQEVPVDDDSVRDVSPDEMRTDSEAPASPVSVLSDDDVHLSERRIINVVSNELRWDDVQPQHFLTWAEDRRTRHYIRYLRAQIKEMKERLRNRIYQLRRYYPQIFDLNFDFGVQPGNTEVAATPTDKHSVGYYHYWRYYYQCRLNVVLNRDSRILALIRGLIPQRNTQWDVASGYTFDARYHLFHAYDPCDDQLLKRIFNPIGVDSLMWQPGLDWRTLESHLTDTVIIESPDDLDVIGQCPDVDYSLDRVRVSSVDLGVLQVVDDTNGYGYTWFNRTLSVVFLEANSILMVTPYRVLGYCARVLRATPMHVAELCCDIATVVRCVRLFISYIVSTLAIGRDLLLLLLLFLHILMYIIIEWTLRYLRYPHEKDTVVLGENYYSLAVSQTFSEANDPVFDSGATSHVWNHLGHFTSFRRSVGTGLNIRLANGTRVQSAGIGDIGPLKNVLYVPDMAHCLISARVLAADGYEMTTGKGARVTRIGDPTSVLLQSDSPSGLYQILQKDFETQLGLCPTVCLVHTLNEDNAMKLHYMLGHASADRCIHMCKCTQFPGLKWLPPRAFQCVKDCPDCAMAKAHRKSFSGRFDVPEFVGQVWQVDVKGPIQCESLVHGNKYVFGLIDLKTKFMVQYFMKTKDEVLQCFKLFYQEYILYVKSRPQNANMGVITIISDRGEFNSNAIASFCLDKGLSPVTTCAYTPEQNGLIERTWRSISEAAIAMLITANLSEPYWELARECAGYIRNRIVGGHPSNDPLSPFEKFYGIKPHVKDFKIFGVWAYVLIPVKEKNHAPKAEQGIFVGYSERKIGGYKVYLPKTSEIVESAHVRCGTSPNRSSFELEPSEKVDVTFLGRELVGVPPSVPLAASAQQSTVTNPNDILSENIPQVRPQGPKVGRSKRGGRTQNIETQLEPRVNTEESALPSPAPVLAPVGVQERNLLMWSVDDQEMTDEFSERTDHPNTNSSQSLIENTEVLMPTPPVKSRASVDACVHIEQMSPEDRVLIRRRLEVVKDTSVNEGESLSPMHTDEDAGAEPMSLGETVPLRRTSISTVSFGATDPLGRTDPWGSIGSGTNRADGLLDPNDDGLDLGSADRLGRTPWPGDSVSAVYPHPTNHISLSSKSARATKQTDTHVNGQVATIKVAEGRCHPSVTCEMSTSHVMTPTAVQLSSKSR